MHRALMAGYANPLRVCDSADFSSDYMLRGAGLTGAADSKSGVLSWWMRLDGGDGSSLHVLNSTGNNIIALRRTDNIVGIGGENAAGTEILLLRSTGTYTAGAAWLHVLASWDLATGAGHLYINDANDLDTGTDVLTNDTIDYTVADWAVGGTPVPAATFDGCLADVYFAPGQYLDLSLVHNRRKFISASGKPVHLGTTGALPTGTAPLIYLHLDDAEAVANFATNRGTGGDFSITGTLATGSSSPSD